MHGRRVPVIIANMFSYATYAFLLALGLCTTTICTRDRRSHPNTEQTRLASMEDVCRLLHPPSSLPQQLKSRAIANTRLKRAFEIDSTFVRGDVDTHTSFTKIVTDLISLRKLPWTRFADIASDAAESYLRASVEAVAFATFIQRITLHVVLVGLLDANLDDTALSVNDIDLVTSGINHLWSASKTAAALPSDLLAEINFRLRRWLPTYTNPIELVIPAYETMWRVVAITIALNHDEGNARVAFREFLKDPNSRQYHRFHNEGPSVEAIIQEVLRLYPPTRRISRAVHTAPPFLPSVLSRFLTREVIKAADIEALQRSDVWGHSAQQYDPMRHHPQRCSDEQRKTLLAFGTGKLACVAKKWAPHAAAVIVAAVLEQVGPDKGSEILAGEALGGREGWEGWVVRRVGGTSDD